MAAPVALELRSVHLRVDGHPFLKGADLTVREGEAVVIAGLAGCGKSFVPRLALGLPGTDLARVRLSGQVAVDGLPVLDLAPHDLQRLRRRIGSVMRDGSLIENMDIRRNVALPLHYHHRDRLSAAEVEARCAVVLADMELSHLARPGIRPVALNREQRLYVSLARALVVEPFLLLLDDPASGLSPAAAHRLCRCAFSYQPRFATPLPEAGSGRRARTRVATCADLRHYLDFGERFFLLCDGQLHEIGDRVAVETSPDPRVHQLLDGSADSAGLTAAPSARGTVHV